MNIFIDNNIIWKYGWFKINETILSTWIVMFVISIVIFLVRLSLNKPKVNLLQIGAETVVSFFDNEISSSVSCKHRSVFIFFFSLFIFILFSNLISIIPIFTSPTASLSTALALIISVLVFSIVYNIRHSGIKFLKKYIEPIIIFLPFNVISEISKMISIPVRLFGNIIGGMIMSMIIVKVKFLMVGFPIFVDLLGIISKFIQAYIFFILSLTFMDSNEQK